MSTHKSGMNVPSSPAGEPGNSTISSRIVLAGGGHSHVVFLRSLAMNPLPGVEVIMVSNAALAPYSGMLPARLAGWYDNDEMHFHLRRLCALAGVTFLLDEITGLDLVRSEFRLRSRPPLYFDLASINVGITPSLPPGADGHPNVVAVKPIATLLSRWVPEASRQWSVVGGGAAGFEIAVILALKGMSVEILDAADGVLASHGARVRNKAAAVLKRLGVRVRSGSRVAAVNGQTLELTNGERVAFEKAVFCTGAKAPAWFAGSGLELSGDGFLKVDEFLRLSGSTRLFGTGDCLDMGVAKAGVYPVRQGPILAENLRRTLAGEPLLKFKPQRKFLALLNSGDRRALMSYKGFTVEGPWVWKWKDWIDRGFMKTFDAREESAGGARMRAVDPETNTCGGCGGKVGPAILDRALKDLGQSGGPEDVGWLDGRAVTVDGFRTFTPDLHFFGYVGCLHALNDLYAAGVRPEAATVAVTLPPASDAIRVNWLRHLMTGVNEALGGAGARLLNAHTGEGAEASVTVTGLGRGVQRWSKTDVKPGHALVITKPLGTGAALRAAMMGALDEAEWRELRAVLSLDHGAALDDVLELASAATDVSGFGLLGHLSEMLAGQWGATLGTLPVLAGYRRARAQGFEAHVARANAVHYSAGLSGTGSLPDLVFDPQTHGPLLIALEASAAEELVMRLRDKGYGQAAVVGAVTEPPGFWFVDKN